MAATLQDPSPHTSTTTTPPSMLFHTVSEGHYYHTLEACFTNCGTCFRLCDLYFIGHYSRGFRELSLGHTGSTLCFFQIIVFLLVLVISGSAKS